MTIRAHQIPCAMVGETLVGSVSFADRLDSGELLTGTPTVAEITSSDLTIDNVAVNSAALTISGQSVSIGQAVQFRVSGQLAATTYSLLVTADTDATPAQTLRGIIRLQGVPAS